MTFISCQPHDIYFLWQVEVQICNFRMFGVSDRMHVLVWYPKGSDKLPLWEELARKFPEVSFFFYEDQGVDLDLYIPQLRPHCLARHFDLYPNLEKEVIFYHDSDIIFNYLPDFDNLGQGEVNWQSDTSSYLDYNYLRRKEDEGNIPANEAISILCEIGNVTLNTFRSYSDKTGGAQYILKGINGDFWRDVERMCVHIRGKFFFGVKNSINDKYFPSEAAGFQSWCADMWAVNMALWSRNKVTDVTSLLDFSWATDDAETYHKKPIMHNAGATGAEPGVFYKGHWIMKSPIGKNHALKKNSASWYYGLAIKEVSKIT